MDKILIHKVKITKKGVEIHYDDPKIEGEPDGVSREGKGEARPSFYRAMDALLEDVINICLLDPDGWGSAEVTGVILKHLEGNIGCVISAQNKSSDTSSPININTPYLDPSSVSSKLRAKLDEIQEEARAYLEGKRAQASLFDNEPQGTHEITNRTVTAAAR